MALGNPVKGSLDLQRITTHRMRTTVLEHPTYISNEENWP